MIYLDHAATTPLEEKVLEAMMPYLRGKFGNPSSVNALGREARAAVEGARAKIAGTLNAEPKEIFFTSGGTESVNAVHKGVALSRGTKGGHFILSAVEHSCVLECGDWLSKNGFEVTRVNVNGEGWVDPMEVEKEMRKDTLLVSIMAANNEVGTIQPFREIGRMCRERGVLFHTDAVQAYGKMDIDTQKDHLDFLSVSAHKIYGPKGAGFFYQRKGLGLVPLIHGGGQERELRGGTENVAGIVGLGEAAKMICGEQEERNRLRKVAELFIEKLMKAVPDARVNGPSESVRRVPGIAHVTVPGLSGEALVQGLDAKGFAVSSGPACAAGFAPPSHVLMAMGRSEKEAKQGLRVSFGRSNTPEDAGQLALALSSLVQTLRKTPSFQDD